MAGIAIATLPLPLAVLLGVGTFASAAVLVRPVLGVALLILAVPFGSPFNLQLGGFNLGPTEALFGLLLAAWLGRFALARYVAAPRRDEHIRVPPPAFALAGFLFVLGCTLVVTHSIPASLKELAKWGEFLIVALIVGHLCSRRESLGLLLLAFVTAAAQAIVGLIQSATNAGPAPFLVPLGGRLFMRSYGTFEQPNPFAAYLNLSIPIIVSVLIWAVTRRRQEAEAERDTDGTAGALVWGSVGAAVPVAAAFFFSLSRGAWFGFTAAAAAMVALRSRRALAAFAALVALAAASLVLGSLNLLPAAIAERIGDIPKFFGLNLIDPRAVVLTDENFAIVDRMAHWFAAWNMFVDHPWLGVGIGNYAAMYSQYGLREWPVSLGHAHNFYLNLLAESGVIGLVSYLLLVICMLGYAWSVARRTRNLERALAFGIFGVFVATAAHNLFDNLFVHGMNLQHGILLGLLARMDPKL